MASEDPICERCGTRHPEVDEAMARHLVQKQILPQLEAERLRRQGIDATTAFVNVRPGAEEGFEVTCAGCGRKARMAIDPGTRVGMCPACALGMR